MSDKKGNGITPIQKEGARFWDGLILNLRLVVRLIKDERINLFLKILPIGALVYLLTPLDILSLNPIDDGLVMWLGSYLFIQLCPKDIVDEHRKALTNPAERSEQTAQDVIDVSFKNKESTTQGD
jgi:hypothetical protein